MFYVGSEQNQTTLYTQRTQKHNSGVIQEKKECGINPLNRSEIDVSTNNTKHRVTKSVPYWSRKRNKTQHDLDVFAPVPPNRNSHFASFTLRCSRSVNY